MDIEGLRKDYYKDMKELVVECEEYLSANPKNSIGHKSKLHQRMRELLGL